MNQAVIRLKIDFTDYVDNSVVSPRQIITVPPGTTIDLDDEPAMEALGIVRPECWAYRHMSSGYNNWQATRSLTFPSTGYAESYNITMAMLADSSYAPSGLGCADEFDDDF